jgi:hypothetical protein
MALLMLADFHTRHPGERRRLVRDLAAMVLADREDGLGLNDVVYLNRLIPVRVGASELLAQLTELAQEEEGDGRGAKAAFVIAELHRYLACAHYLSVTREQPQTVHGIERHLLPMSVRGGDLRIAPYVQRLPAGTSLQEKARTALDGLCPGWDAP